MEDKRASSSIPTQKNAAIGQSETVVQEHRQAYGTAKTENLRTSDLWRILLPTFVILCGLALIVIPLLILIPLLSHSIAAIGDAKQTNEVQLLWVWITMIVLEMALCAVIGRWIFRVFFSQKTSYQH